MSQAMHAEAGLSPQPAARLRLVSLLGETLAVSLANLPVLLTLSFLAGLPLILASTPWGQSSYEQYLGLTLLGLTTWNLRAGFAFHLVAGALAGRRVRLATSFQEGTEEAFGAIKVAAALGAIAWLVFLLLVVPGLMMARIHPEWLLAGTLLFSVAGLWLMSVFGVSVPLAIREKTSVLESLRQSARLSRGHRWMLALLFAVFTVSDLAANRLLAFASAAPGTLVFARHIVLVIIGALGAPVLPIVYFHLRRGRDSRSVEALAAIFD